MGNLLYLVHRLPYPPNKGDKVRSYHLLKHLATKHRVFLGTFIDDPDDEAYIDTVRDLCAGLHVVRLSPRWARLRSLSGLFTDEALTLPYYRDSGLQRWVTDTCRVEGIDCAVVFSSAMAQYVRGMYRVKSLVDFVDVDSAKWSQYAGQHRWPLSWIYRREGERLLAFERAVAARAARSFFVTENETELFRRLAPECAVRIEAMANGVDADYFAPLESSPSPYDAAELPVVFTGAMDYWPNIDGAIWFAGEVLPLLKQKWPQARFYVVGRNPAPAVQALASPDVVVTGTVADVRPYLQHAPVVVAPLRIARGVQNKVLEAMAMARPVIASAACAGGVDATPGREFLTADGAAEFVQVIDDLLRHREQGEQIGSAGRQRVLARYSWEANMATIDRHLDSGLQLPPQEAA